MNTKPDTAILDMNDASAIAKIHPDDRAKVLDTHTRLPGQRLATTVYNALFHGTARPAATDYARGYRDALAHAVAHLDTCAASSAQFARRDEVRGAAPEHTAPLREKSRVYAGAADYIRAWIDSPHPDPQAPR